MPTGLTTITPKNNINKPSVNADWWPRNRPHAVDTVSIDVVTLHRLCMAALPTAATRLAEKTE
jgi:hypothetical protein